MKATENDLEQLCINTIRMLAPDAVQRANSGHPGTPMGLAPLGYLLWTQFLKHNPKNPLWPDRDRFEKSVSRGEVKSLYAPDCGEPLRREGEQSR